MKLLLNLSFLIILLNSSALFASAKDYYPADLESDPISFEEKLYKLLSKTHQGGISYKKARIELFGNIHLKKTGSKYSVTEVYCRKKFSSAEGVGPGKIPNHQFLNCEHTWPKSRFNPNESKNHQLTDLHHLYPTDSRANSTRKNHLFSMVDGKPLKNCASSKYGKGKNDSYLAFEPPAEHRGNVARALFYFSVRYNIQIDDAEEEYLRKWHKADPVDAFERKRNDMVEKFQGNRNPFTDNPNWTDRISNF
ncbi:MAG: endonuclease I [Bacteriovoracaceae bacterium]|jgi:endonuclease I